MCPGKWTLLIPHIFFSFPPLLGSLLPYWSTGLITQFLDLSQAVGLLGQVISLSQGLYLNTGQHKHRKTQTHIKHPCSGPDSNPQSRPPSDQWLFMLQTTWLLRPAFQIIQARKFMRDINMLEWFFSVIASKFKKTRFCWIIKKIVRLAKNCAGHKICDSIYSNPILLWYVFSEIHLGYAWDVYRNVCRS
jgi:hypothetical protein